MGFNDTNSTDKHQDAATLNNLNSAYSSSHTSRWTYCAEAKSTINPKLLLSKIAMYVLVKVSIHHQRWGFQNRDPLKAVCSKES
jgi:hypothetical protein